jgi:NAD(P)-dependent dehydrogenase (short-subunit alcohol dehydrogenase family)
MGRLEFEGCFMKLKDKVAVITGAGRGIGQAIAVAFAREGARVVLGARNEAELRETGARVEAAGSEPLIVPTDVTDRAQAERLAAAAVERFGRIDILVNNAGISGPIGPLQDNDIAEWVDTINVNLTGTFLVCRAVIPVMVGQGSGRIINLSGAGAANAWSNMSAYCSSKVAVVRLTEVLAQELEQKGITVNALGPGSVHTTMWDKMTEDAAQAGATFIHETGLRVTSGGGASIDECAELAVWLAGEESAGLTGRLISAATDDFRGLPPRIAEIMAGDAYTLRRVGLP